MYQRMLKSGVLICSTQDKHAAALEELQTICFPTTAAEHLIRAKHYLHHIQMFPQGQFVALDGRRVVGMSSTIRVNFDFDQPLHTYDDLFQEGWMTAHDPAGEWLYGMDMGVHPDYRGKGIAKALYKARMDNIVRPCNMKGMLLGGMLRGYGVFKEQMSAEEYYARVLRKELGDPTISAQMSVGFEPICLLPNYIHATACDNWGVLMKMEGIRDIQAD